MVDAWLTSGVIQRWPARIARFEHGRLSPSPDERERYVAQPGMNALGKHLARDLLLRCQTRVAPPQREDGHWRLRDEAGGELGLFDAVVIAGPAPQAAELLRPQAPAFADRAAAVRYDPMWALMARVDDQDPVGFDGVFVSQPPFRWLARNHSKPGRQGNSWVAHAGAEWTRAHLDLPAEQAAELLAREFAQMLGIPDERVVPLGAHRWLYSLVAQPLDIGALYDPVQRLAVCGDWCQGARIEGAWLSGLAASGRLLGQLAGEYRE